MGVELFDHHIKATHRFNVSDSHAQLFELISKKRVQLFSPKMTRTVAQNNYFSLLTSRNTTEFAFEPCIHMHFDLPYRENKRTIAHKQ